MDFNSATGDSSAPRFSLAGGEQVELPLVLSLPGDVAIPDLPELGAFPDDAQVAQAAEGLGDQITQVEAVRQKWMEGFSQALEAIRLFGADSQPIPVGELAAQTSQQLRDALAEAGYGLSVERNPTSPLLTA